MGSKSGSGSGYFWIKSFVCDRKPQLTNIDYCVGIGEL